MTAAVAIQPRLARCQSCRQFDRAGHRCLPYRSRRRAPPLDLAPPPARRSPQIPASEPGLALIWRLHTTASTLTARERAALRAQLREGVSAARAVRADASSAPRPSTPEEIPDA